MSNSGKGKENPLIGSFDHDYSKESKMTTPQEKKEFWLTRGNNSGPNELTHICLFEYHADKNPLRLVEHAALVASQKECEELKTEIKRLNTTTVAVANKILIRENEELKRKLDRFITLSNGISFYAREPSQNYELSKTVPSLVAKIEQLYAHQCECEFPLTKIGAES